MTQFLLQMLRLNTSYTGAEMSRVLINGCKEVVNVQKITIGYVE